MSDRGAEDDDGGMKTRKSGGLKAAESLRLDSACSGACWVMGSEGESRFRAQK